MSSNSNKRKSDESEQTHRRAKRNRYISIACNECKRRKIKCNGQSPCQRCGNLNLECVYAPNCCNGFKESDEYRHMTGNISELQHQVQLLFANLSSLKAYVENRPDAIETPGSSSGHVPGPATTNANTAKYPRFHGPTSAAFGLGVAKSSLTRNFGITGIDETAEEQQTTNEVSPAGTPPPVHTNPSKPVEPRDILWTINKDECIRLINIWKEHVHLMYPVVDLDRTMKFVHKLYSGNQSDGPFSDDETNTLRLVLANAVEVESNGSSEFGLELFRDVAAVIESLMMRAPSLRALEHLVLAALFYFHRDDEVLSWRLNGMAGRMSFELGLHQQDSYISSMSSQAQRFRSNVLFWSIYVLDRRWSFGVGLPFVLQEMDIDPDLIKPSSPYLSNMVQLSSISSRIWPRVTNAHRTTNPDVGELEYLDLQVVRWQQGLPEELNYTKMEQNSRDHVSSRLRVLLYLRANQTRILIGRQVLMSTSAIMENLNYANVVVGVAKDTIQVLKHLNQTTETYRKQQSLYNYFLISALAGLFLAVAHAPAQFSNTCRDEFHMALDIVRGLSSNSFIGKRLWKTIRVLKEIGPKIGLIKLNASGTEGPSDADSDAAVAMAGLAGHPVENISIYPPIVPNDANPQGGWDNWEIMADDLGGLFEAAGNMPGPVTTIERGNGPRDMANLFSVPDGLSRAFKDLF